MYSRFYVLFATLMALALFVAANPVPNPEGVVARKPLKQYDIKRAIADAKKRRASDDEDHKPKPSKYVSPPSSPTPLTSGYEAKDMQRMRMTDVCLRLAGCGAGRPRPPPSTGEEVHSTARFHSPRSLVGYVFS